MTVTSPMLASSRSLLTGSSSSSSRSSLSTSDASSGLATLRKKLATWALSSSGPSSTRVQSRTTSNQRRARGITSAPNAPSGSLLPHLLWQRGATPASRRLWPVPAIAASFSTTARLGRTSDPASSSSSSSSSTASSSSTTPERIADGVRNLMRSSAQPVVLLLVLVPSSSTPSLGDPSISSNDSSPASMSVHGATLSSFTTISLNPPLIAFSLQMPSRAAKALIRGKESKRSSTTSSPAHFVVNVLSSQHASLASVYARPGLETLALAGNWDAARDEVLDHQVRVMRGEEGKEEQIGKKQHPLRALHLVPSSASHEGVAVPRITAGLGSLACELVQCIDTAELVGPAEAKEGARGKGDEAEHHGSRSMLFIARVHDVNILDTEETMGGSQGLKGRGQDERSNQDKNLPLVYWDRKMTTVRTDEGEGE